jgi:hypothetical protein
VPSSWYVRKVRTIDVVLEAGETAREEALLFKLGLGMDFYPRLVGVA